MITKPLSLPLGPDEGAVSQGDTGNRPKSSSRQMPRPCPRAQAQAVLCASPPCAEGAFGLLLGWHRHKHRHIQPHGDKRTHYFSAKTLDEAKGMRYTPPAPLPLRLSFSNTSKLLPC